MNKDKFLKILKYSIYAIIISSFMIIYSASEAGYFDNIKNRRVALTEEQIARFEEDIALGKEINTKDYYNEVEDSYSNKISKLGSYISEKIQKVVTVIMDKSFKALNDFLNS